MLKQTLIAAGLLGIAAAPLLAQGQHSGMSHGQMMNMNMQNMQNTPANPYAQAEMSMSHRMMEAVGANPDETWARKMIEHHRGAIETGRILIAKGRDAELKRMAQKSMAEQQKEIADLENWLRRHGQHAH